MQLVLHHMPLEQHRYNYLPIEISISVAAHLLISLIDKWSDKLSLFLSGLIGVIDTFHRMVS